MIIKQRKGAKISAIGEGPLTPRGENVRIVERLGLDE